MFRKKFFRLYKLILNKFLSNKGLEKYFILNKINNIIKSVVTPSYVIIDGHKIYLDKLDSLNLSTKGVHEPFETSIVKKYVSKGDTVLDIGANIGYYTLLFARIVGPLGKVYAFEPEPSTFKLLKKNISVNNYKNVCLVNKAVSDTESKIPFYVSKNNLGGHSIYKPDKGSSKTFVDAIILDKYFNNDFKVDFIKIDIEGAEVKALKGMKNIIKRSPELKILTEINPFMLSKSGTGVKELFDYITDLGFTFYLLDYKNNKLVKSDKNNIIKLKRCVNILLVKE